MVAQSSRPPSLPPWSPPCRYSHTLFPPSPLSHWHRGSRSFVGKHANTHAHTNLLLVKFDWLLVSARYARVADPKDLGFFDVWNAFLLVCSSFLWRCTTAVLQQLIQWLPTELVYSTSICVCGVFFVHLTLPYVSLSELFPSDQIPGIKCASQERRGYTSNIIWGF